MEGAIITFRLTASHQRELARAVFLLGKLLRKVDMEEQAQSKQEEAASIRNLLIPANVKFLPDLRDEHFDNLVVILKR